jgi:hypothetical protein
MVSEKEIFFQVLDRYMDNILRGFNPMVALMSAPIKNWVFNYIEPYVDAFLAPDRTLNVNAASAFLKQEVSSKIEQFMKDFEDTRKD